MKEILKHIYWLKLGSVNAYLIDHGDLTLIDTGNEGNATKIIEAIKGTLGKSISQLKHIIVTHHHPDHAGSLAALQNASGAEVYMHPIDAELVEKGIPFRNSLTASPGVMNWLMYKFIINSAPRTIPASKVHHLINDGDFLSIGAGFEVIHVPGHSKGQIALLYKAQGGVLFATDTAANFMGLSLMPLYEDVAQAKRDLKRLCELDFEVAALGHGAPIVKEASIQFLQKFGAF